MGVQEHSFFLTGFSVWTGVPCDISVPTPPESETPNPRIPDENIWGYILGWRHRRTFHICVFRVCLSFSVPPVGPAVRPAGFETDRSRFLWVRIGSRRSFFRSQVTNSNPGPLIPHFNPLSPLFSMSASENGFQTLRRGDPPAVRTGRIFHRPNQTHVRMVTIDVFPHYSSTSIGCASSSMCCCCCC